MRCDYCLHYGVCTFAKQYETVDKCTDFADKDLYIKLPCKVGDEVYFIKFYIRMTYVYFSNACM